MKIIEQLLVLQNLELGPSPIPPESQEEIAKLRGLVPPTILAHYDRLMTRGKKGVSVVRNGVCAECHMRMASGIFARLLRAEDITICDTCGRYLIAAPGSIAAEVAAPPVEAPKKKRGRKKATPPAEPEA